MAQRAAGGLLVVVLLWGAGCQAARPGAMVPGERIYDVEAAAFRSWSELRDELVEADYVLLGERHDNPAHHAVQAFVIDELGRERALSVGFEQIEADRQEAVEAHLRQAGWTTAGLDEALEWEASGWPGWWMYEPVFAATLGHEVVPVGLNLPGRTLEALREQGLDGADDEAFVELLDAAAWGERQERALRDELERAHHGRASGEVVERMSVIQRSRDAQMAHVMREARGADELAVMIMGKGHAYRDRGVPIYLAAAEPEARVISIAMMECEVGEVDDAAALGEKVNDFYDWVWVTQAVDRPGASEQLEAIFDGK